MKNKVVIGNMAEFFEQMCAVLAETGRKFPGQLADPEPVKALFAASPRRPEVASVPPVSAVPPRHPAPAASPAVPPPRVPAAPAVPGAPGIRLPEISASASAAENLAALGAAVAGCRSCPLAAGRCNLVFGEGNPDARLMFIGEGPGGDEDRLGRPFVGRAGQLLDRMIAAMQFSREEVYIANIVKCRPPGNRNPMPEEVAACLPILVRQIRIVRPEVIVLLGAVAVKALFGSDRGISKMRGRWTSWENIPVMPTFHPAFLLRQESAKREAWQDLQLVMARFGKVYRRK